MEKQKDINQLEQSRASRANQLKLQEKLAEAAFEGQEKLAESNKGEDVESIKADIEALNKIWSSASEKMYKDSSEANNAQNSKPETSTETPDSEIKDADYEVVDDKKE